MTTITEDYVSFEIAKLLKSKKFHIPTRSHYDGRGGFGFLDICEIDWNYYKCFRERRCYSAPTLQMAMKWLREVYNIFIVIEPHKYDYINEKNSSYVTSLWQGDNYYENITSKDYPTYEEAIEATLKFSLENLI